jgi:hypothetical protein
MQAAQSHADHKMVPHAAPTPRRASGHQAAAAAHKPTDPAVLFTRLAAVVRDCIALEARLAVGAADAPSARMRRADPRRAPVHEALRAATENHPDAADLLREATTCLDEHLAADPEKATDAAHLLLAICDELGIELDLATLPDDILFAFAETADPGDDIPDPRATSPP